VVAILFSFPDFMYSSSLCFTSCQRLRFHESTPYKYFFRTLLQVDGCWTLHAKTVFRTL